MSGRKVFSNFKDSLTGTILNGFTLGPVVEPEHEDAFFTGISHDKLLNGNFTKVPILIGYNSNEAGIFKKNCNQLEILK